MLSGKQYDNMSGTNQRKENLRRFLSQFLWDTRCPACSNEIQPMWDSAPVSCAHCGIGVKVNYTKLEIRTAISGIAAVVIGGLFNGWLIPMIAIALLVFAGSHKGLRWRTR
jgi:ribosomal protein S27E